MQKLVVEIEASIKRFQDDAVKLDNKAAARRARKESIVLTKLLKKYRSQSIK